jgi:hypothetical protein
MPEQRIINGFSILNKSHLKKAMSFLWKDTYIITSRRVCKYRESKGIMIF